ncbi:ABC1 kinase family protein [Agaribacter flavus]|uniref:ABC1 kinase family protein n=1 Tax=Agaribacter flavus TaxID=1902781 RepID=A0ABV7FV19_9ALTE
MKRSSKVPSTRLGRLGKLGGLAAKITASVVTSSAQQIIKAQRPSLQKTLLTTSNAQSITQHLAQMRGAAMKVGQMLSMDAGEFLPKEWEPILARLRQGADSMPKAQLLFMLNTYWGRDWQSQFTYFSFEPMASASIGQVHRATLKNGRELAIKVQYPGIAESIDSDIDNVGKLLKLSGLLPPQFDICKLLNEAKAQLKREADYTIERDYLTKYKSLIGKDSTFVVPDIEPQLCNQHILAMEYIDGIGLEKLAEQSQADIDSCMQSLVSLTLRELFDFGFMQSDPNFANFLLLPHTKQIALLDFGACCELSSKTQATYKQMATGMQMQDASQIRASLMTLGLLQEDMPENIIQTVVDASLMASECLQVNSYHLKNSRLIQRLYQRTQSLIRNNQAVASPDFDTALVNRKISGMILLANKLGANLQLRPCLAPYLK